MDIILILISVGLSAVVLASKILIVKTQFQEKPMAHLARFMLIHIYLGKLRHCIQKIYDCLSCLVEREEDVTNYL